MPLQSAALCDREKVVHKCSPSDIILSWGSYPITSTYITHEKKRGCATRLAGLHPICSSLSALLFFSGHLSNDGGFRSRELGEVASSQYSIHTRVVPIGRVPAGCYVGRVWGEDLGDSVKKRRAWRPKLGPKHDEPTIIPVRLTFFEANLDVSALFTCVISKLLSQSLV
jgi:hypothetical protein